MNYKKNLRIFIYIFIIILVLSFTFSKTIYNNFLPQIEMFVPIQDKLTKSAVVYSNADYYLVENEYSKFSGIVESFDFKVGDKINKNDLIAVIHEEKDIKEEDYSSELDKINIERAKIKLQIKEIESEKKRYSELIKELENENHTLDINDYTYKIRQIEEKIEIADKEYQKMKILYDNGVISKEELDSYEIKIKEYYYEIENLMELKNADERRLLEAANEKEKIRKEKISEYRYLIENIEYRINNLKLDEEMLNVQESSYKTPNLQAKSVFEIYAGFDGIVTETFINKGQNIIKGQQLLSVGVGNTYKIECSVSEQINFIEIGDECSLDKLDTSYKGQVENILPDGENNRIIVTTESDNNIIGQRFKVEFKKESNDRHILIPNSSIFEDTSGYYVYKISKRKGVLGQEYYISKKYIHKGDSSDSYTIASEGIDEIVPYVLRTNKQLHSGSSVRIVNEDDLIAN